jgi:tRNA (guanine-N7-)-methyltransferase
VLREDAVPLLEQAFAPASFVEVLLWFPDPWPKKRHHKRRLVQPRHLPLLTRVLVKGGRLRLATDWLPYAEAALDCLNAEATLENVAVDRGFIARPADRVLTRFEQRGLALGHPVRDLEFRRR